MKGIIIIGLLIATILLSGCIESESHLEPEVRYIYVNETPTPEPEATPTPTPAVVTPTSVLLSSNSVSTPIPSVIITQTPIRTPTPIPSSTPIFTPTSTPLTGCAALDQNILRMYDQDQDGLVDDDWVINAAIDFEHRRLSQSGYDQIKYAYEHRCIIQIYDPTPVPTLIT